MVVFAVSENFLFTSFFFSAQTFCISCNLPCVQNAEYDAATDQKCVCLFYGYLRSLYASSYFLISAQTFCTGCILLCVQNAAPTDQKCVCLFFFLFFYLRSLYASCYFLISAQTFCTGGNLPCVQNAECDAPTDQCVCSSGFTGNGRVQCSPTASKCKNFFYEVVIATILALAAVCLLPLHIKCEGVL